MSPIEDQEDSIQSAFSPRASLNDSILSSNTLMDIALHYSQLTYTAPAPYSCSGTLKYDGALLPYFLTEETLQELHKQEYGVAEPEVNIWQRFCEQEESSDEEDDTVIDLKQTVEKKQKSKIRAKKTTYKYKKRRHQCMQCPKKFLTLKALTLHVRVHTGEKTDQCPECGDLFNQYCNLKRHAYGHVVEQNPDKKLLPYICAKCNHAALQSYTIKEHLKGYHRLPKDKIDYMIIQDDKKKAELNDLTKKLLAKKYVPKSDESQEKEKAHAPKKQNRQHNAVKRAISCQKPNIIVQSKQAYLTPKKYGCFICQEQCTSQNRLQHHIQKIHCTLRPYFCPNCLHSGIAAWVVQRHLKKLHNIIASKEIVETCYYDLNQAQQVLQNAHNFLKQISSSSRAIVLM